MEHNWVFSADQMEDMTAVPGLISSICICWTFNFLSNLFYGKLFDFVKNCKTISRRRRL